MTPLIHVKGVSLKVGLSKTYLSAQAQAAAELAT